MGGGRAQDDDADYDDDEEYGYVYDDEYGNEGDEVYDDEAFLEGDGSVKPTKKPHARHSGDHTQTHWWHRRRQKNGKEGTWKQTAEQAGYWMGLVAVALFILIGWAFDAASFDLRPRIAIAATRSHRAGTTRS